MHLLQQRRSAVLREVKAGSELLARAEMGPLSSAQGVGADESVHKGERFVDELLELLITT